MTIRSDFQSGATDAVRRYDIPMLALRRRSDEHPMAMFGVIVALVFASMFVLQMQGPASAAVEPVAVEHSSDPVTTDKDGRLAPTETDRACQGQAWGAETPACIAMISKESGKSETRKIRMVFADKIDSSRPNIF